MIGKRANSRMKPDTIDTNYNNRQYNYNFNSQQSKGNNSTDTLGRRMTNFFRNVMGASFASEDKSEWDESDIKSGGSLRSQRSPILHNSTGSKKKIFLRNIRETPMQSNSMKSETHLKFPSIQRTKKYSFGHEVANDHIPQTIAEHPHESDESADNNYVIAEPRTGQSQLNTSVQSNTPNRRESGGSYASSVESFPTEQTSVNDKRLSASTMVAVTPPTPLNPTQSPTVNEFFPNDEGLLRPEQQSLIAGGDSDSKTPVRPSMDRFYSFPCDEAQCSNKAYGQINLQTSQIKTDKQQSTSDFAYKLLHKSFLKKNNHKGYEESSLNGNSNNSKGN